MESIHTAQIVYFSGTGGTARIAGHLRAALAGRGVAVTVTELAGKARPTEKTDLLIVLFAVYAANAPLPVEEWIHATPEGGGTRAAVLSVSGGGETSPNTACRAPTIRRLQRKGYDVVYERMLVMPSNFIMPYGDELNALLLAAAPRKAQRVADELLSGQTRRTVPAAMDRIATRLCSAEKLGSRLFGRHLKANGQCVGCGWCAAHCPRGNITMEAGRPAFGWNCVLCLRCVYGCPSKAIEPAFFKSAVFKDGFDLAALEARTAGKESAATAEALTSGRMLAGVREYLLEE